MAVIERQTQHITRLVDDLLDVSRITRGKITLRPERVALASVVERAVEAIRPVVETRRQSLSVALPPAPLEVEADIDPAGAGAVEPAQQREQVQQRLRADRGDGGAQEARTR